MNSMITAGVLAVASLAAAQGAQAQEVIKFGMSVPLSGTGAPWGKAAEFLCKSAAKDIKEAGGIKVKGKSYNLECIAYDNKYTSAEGTKVAQTLINRDGVKYMCAIGSAPILAAQSLTERAGVLMFTQAWAKSGKGPKFPLSFSDIVTPFEVGPAMIEFVRKTYPNAKTVAMLNPGDATGRETEEVLRPMWEKAGVKVLSSDFYERGTTEFQPIALRLASLKADIVDLGSTAPPDMGQVLKEMAGQGWKGVKVGPGAAASEGIVAAGGAAAEGLYMGAAFTFDGPEALPRQRKLNMEQLPITGESLGIASVPCYDAVQMLKAGMEKAQSIEPKAIAAVMPGIKFNSFWGDNVAMGGKSIYGADIQPILPVHITQIENGKTRIRGKVVPKY